MPQRKDVIAGWRIPSYRRRESMNHLDAMQRSSLPLLVMAGTLVRFAFGSSHELWNSAPDQLAWGLALEDLVNGGTFAYKQLIHYPHEGGSSFLGLLAFLFVPLSGIMPPLSWAALLVDTLVRIIQINVAHRLFGARTAMWFAVWTVFAAPLMLPWSIIDFGLHALMSFAPFVLISRTAFSRDRRPVSAASIMPSTSSSTPGAPGGVRQMSVRARSFSSTVNGE